MDYVKHLSLMRNNKKYNQGKTNKPNDVEIDWLDEYIKNMD